MTTPGDSKEEQVRMELFHLLIEMVKRIESRTSKLASILINKQATTDDKIQELRQYALALKANHIRDDNTDGSRPLIEVVTDSIKNLTISELETFGLGMYELMMEPLNEFTALIKAAGAILADKSLDNQQKIHDIEDIVLVA